MNKHIILVFLLLLSSMAFSQPDYGEPKVYTLSGVNVEGAEFSDESNIVNMSGLSIGDPVTVPGQEIANAIKNLWKQSLFSDIQIEADRISGDKIFLVIKVKERPRISTFSFEGISKAQADDLRENINFIRGTILTKSKKQSAKRIIRNYYVDKGFFNVTSEIAEAPDKVLKNAVTVNIKVDKGKRIKIDEIIIDDNEVYVDKKIKRKLKKVKEKKFWRIWARSKFIPKYFEEGKAAILSYYNEQGYRDASIEFDTVYNHDAKSVKVQMKLYEGKQYYFRDIKWVGNLKYNSNILQRVLNIKKGDVYSKSKLDRRLFGSPNGGDVSSLYLDDGYLFFNVDAVEVLVEGDSIDLEMRMAEGPQAKISNIIIEGNTKTSDYVIMREIRTRPGDKFSRADVIRSQREIINLGYFNEQNIQIQPKPNPTTGTVDIKYVVEERASDQLQLQGGWGGRIRNAEGDVIGGGFVGTVQLAFNNFSTKRMFQKGAWAPVPSGDGQKLSVAFQMNGTQYQNFTLSFTEPWLGGKKPNSLSFASSYILMRNIGSEYRNNIFSTSVDYGKRLSFPDDFFRSYTSLSYKYYDVRNPQFIFRGFEDDGSNLAYINILSFRQTFDRTSIDAPLFPTSGSIINFSVEATPPYSIFSKDKDYKNMSDAKKFNLLEFHKWKFKSNWFVPVVGKMVLSAKVEAAFLGSYNGDIGISPFERFYLGGAGLVGFNGFDGREIIPLRGYQDNVIDGRSDKNPETGLGAVMYNKFSLEFRYPIVMSQATSIWALAFAEGGNGFNNFKEYNPFNLKRSLGAGVRIMLPMVGLLGVDWGYGFDGIIRPGDGFGGSQFHFVFGQQF